MKLVYAVSQRSNSKHPTVRHIDNGNGKPLCGGNGREPFFWAPEEGEPTCKICMDLAILIQPASETADSKQRNGD